MSNSKIYSKGRTQTLQPAKKRRKKKYSQDKRYLQLNPMMPSGFTASERARLKKLEKKIMER